MGNECERIEAPHRWVNTNFTWKGKWFDGERCLKCGLGRYQEWKYTDEVDRFNTK
jgi:hypothetical protein